MITLLPIAALYVFGGATLQDFAFAIIVGITVGAVGTIFVATPLLAALLEHDPGPRRTQGRRASPARSLTAPGGGRDTPRAPPPAPNHPSPPECALRTESPQPLPLVHLVGEGEEDRERNNAANDPREIQLQRLGPKIRASIGFRQVPASA